MPHNQVRQGNAAMINLKVESKPSVFSDEEWVEFDGGTVLLTEVLTPSGEPVIQNQVMIKDRDMVGAYSFPYQTIATAELGHYQFSIKYNDNFYSYTATETFEVIENY